MDTVDAYIRDIGLGKLPAPRGYWDWFYAGMPQPQPFDEHWIEHCAAVRMGWALATGTVIAAFPLLPEPSARTLERWDFIKLRDAHHRQYGYPDWERRHGECTVCPTPLGRQLVAGYFQRSSKFDPDAIHVELSIDRDHPVVPAGKTMQERMTRMFNRLKRCEERQAVKVVTTPKVIYAGGQTVQPEVSVDPWSEFTVGQAVEYRTWEGRNENYRQVWKPAVVEVIGAKKIQIQFGKKMIWVQKRSLRPIMPEGVNQWQELVQLTLF